MDIGMDIERFLATHDGVVSRAQARRCGLSDGQIARRVARGDWIRRAPRVFFARAWTWTAAAHVRVAAEWAGPTGTLVAVTAAWWLGLGVARPYPVTVALPPGCSRAGPPGIRMVQRAVLGDRRRSRGLWVTGVAVTVLDAAVALEAEGRAFLGRALQQHVSLDELRTAQNRHLARHGSAAAGAMLAEAADRTASDPERLMVRLLRAAGLQGWSVNLDVVLSTGLAVHLDVAFADVRLAIEVDGWAHHVDRDRFVGDRVRQRALTVDGWTVIHVTWDDLVRRPDEVVADIRRILLRLSAGPVAS